MGKGQDREIMEALYKIAETQEGLFTSSQAEDAGFRQSNHVYHVQVGNWIREHRGIFRLAHYPHSDNEQYVLWSLWSRNRDQEIQGVFSHETALSFYDLSDLNPSKLHMTVPKDFKRMVKPPKILVIHRGEISANDYTLGNGFKMCKPLRAIQDLFLEQSVELTFLKQALFQGLKRGLITKTEMRNPKLPEKFRLAISDWALEKNHL